MRLIISLLAAIPLLLVSPIFGEDKTSPAKPTDNPTGIIVKKLKTLHDPNQTYDLFLPAEYTKEKQWPILYAFSPGAKGNTPVKLFKAPADKYGWIVVGSNNSRNGPFKPIEEAVEAIWKDTHARFSINKDRIYSTGFSGGARVAFHTAYKKGGFAGVIPCGAGFPNSKDNRTPKENSPLLICGIVGKTCFNYHEMQNMVMTLGNLNVTGRLHVFEGGHTWPPKPFAAKAVKFMELNHRLKNKVPLTPALEKALAADLKETEEFLSNKENFLEGYHRLKGWVKTLKNTSRGEKLSHRKEEIENSDQYKQEKTAAKKWEEIRTGVQISSDNEKSFEEFLSNAEVFIASYKDTFAGRTATQRIKGLPFRLLYGGQRFIIAKDYEKALMLIDRAALMDPDHQRVHYLRAIVYANTDKKKEACESLAKAVENGYSDYEKLKTGPYLEPIRKEKEYAAIIKSLPEKSKDKK